LYIGLKQQSLTRVVIVGFWATLHMIAWFVGNSALGLFKGPVDRYINGNKFTRALAGIIPVILAASLMTAITVGQYVVPLVILNMLIGFPCIAASDALADETISRMLTDKHFGIVQYVSTSIIGKGLFAIMSDNITSNGITISYLGWIFAVIAIMIHLFCIIPNAPPTRKTTDISKKSSFSGNFGFLLFTPLLLKLWESIFTDVPLSSLKFIAPLMIYDDSHIVSNTSITFVEMIAGIVVLNVIAKWFTNMNFKDLWRKYIIIHGISSLVRVTGMILLYYISPISKGSNIINGSFNTSSGNTLIYGMSDVNLIFWKVLFILIIILNTTVDAVSSVLLIMLLKGYSRQKTIRYSILDGWVRVYTFTAMMPIIKRNRYLSMYNSNGSIVSTLMISIGIYIIIQTRGIWEMLSFKDTDKKDM
tara:strand:- start:4938 stop:6194 length:1257 start_codon:yes stop_codon:yes gene_type:complete